MSRRSFPALSAIALLSLPALCAAQVPLQTRNYAISGSVHNDSNDEPIQDARVQLLGEPGNVVHPIVLTNRNGEFAFGQFRPSQYDIVVEREGFSPVRLRVDITQHDELNVVIRLRADAKETSPGGNVTSAHELSIPKKAREAFDKGVAEMNSAGDYLTALEEFRRAVSIFPDYYEAYTQMGVAYVRIKNFEAAETALRKSITLSGNKYLPPLLLLSMVLNDTERPVDAETVARQATAADAKSWRAHYELAHALLGLNRIPEAEVSGNAARDLKPESPEVYLLLAEIHRRTKNPQALLQDFDNYLRLAPEGQAAPKVRRMREQLLAGTPAQSNSPPRP